jgi:hypothetical protein
MSVFFPATNVGAVEEIPWKKRLEGAESANIRSWLYPVPNKVESTQTSIDKRVVP